MGELKPNNRVVEEKLDEICCLLSRSVVLQEDAKDLGKQNGETSVSLLRHADTVTDLAQKRNGLVPERTSLVCAETHSSTGSTELSKIPNLAREGRNLAVERTDVAALRTALAPDRTSPSEQNVYMAEMRTCLAETRNMLAISRTIYCKTRTELARGRTYLALIRTGLAFFTIAVFLFRQFGVSWWTAFDASIAAASLAATAVGIFGYKRTVHTTKNLDLVAAEHEASQSDLKVSKA